MDNITFALAKGRLAETAMEMLGGIGIYCPEMHEKSRKLIFSNHDLNMNFFLAKAGDVPTYVEYGCADIGVIGKDTLIEENRNLYELLDLNFGVCRFVVAGKKSAASLINSNDLRVATKYPHIAKQYFYTKKHQTVEIIKLNGSVELGPVVGLADVIVDIVETGSTLKANGLEILEEICPVSARIVANRVSMKLKNERIADVISKLKKSIEQC